jgi:hypothetical protein
MNIRQLPCFRRVNWNPDRHDRRRFAAAMLIGFAALALLKVVRLHHLSPGAIILGSVGVALALGAVTPGLGRATYLGVYLPTSVIGYGVSRMILTLIYFLLFVPLGLFLRWRGKDLMRLRPRGRQSDWIAHRGVRDAASYYRQF